MPNKTFILKEIKKYYKLKTDAEFARFLGVKPNSLANWYSRNTLDYEIVIAKCKDIDGNWLLTGEGPMLKANLMKSPVFDPSEQDMVSKRELLSDARAPQYSLSQLSEIMIKIFDHNKFIPLNKEITIAGFDSESSREREQAIDYYCIPSYYGIDGAITVSGDMMSPVLQSGDVVFYSNIDFYKEDINYGEIYLLNLDVDDGSYTTIKRIEPSKNGSDWIRLVSCNRKYSARDILLNTVKSAAYIKAYLHRFDY